MLALEAAEDVHRLLLSRFLPSLYGPGEAARTGRWLAFLVRHLAVSPGDPNLAWWLLARAVPSAITVALGSGAGTAVGAMTGCAIPVILGGSSHDMAIGTAIGAATGLLLALVTGVGVPGATRDAGRPSSGRTRLRAVAAVLQDLCLVVAVLSAVAAAVLLGLLVHARSSAEVFAMLIIDFPAVGGWQDNEAAVYIVAFYFLLLLLLVVMARLLCAGRAGIPQRSALRVSSLLMHLLRGVAGGLLAGLPWLILGVLSAAGVVDSSSLQDGVSGMSMTAIFFGLPVGLAAWMRRPVAQLDSLSPATVLRHDRAAALRTTDLVATVVGSITVALLLITSNPVRDACAGGLGAATGAAIVILVGSRSAWLAWLVARL